MALGGADTETDAGESAAIADHAAAEATEDHSPHDAGVFEESWEEDAPLARGGWAMAVLAILAIAGWTGFFVWSQLGVMQAGGTPQQWTGWIAQWSTPVLLVVALWLLAMRTSTREAARFGDAARLLSSESQALERRLAAVNAELSLARDFIAAQGRDLESLGRVAAERLSSNADRLQALIRDNGEQVSAIGEVSDTALSNMDKLRDRLPVIANSARDVTSQIAHAGNTAQDQLAELIAGFQRLNEFGEASGRQADLLDGKVSEAIARFEARLADLDRQTQDRFTALRERDEAFRLDLETRETDALASLRRRAGELAAELETLSSQHREREDSGMAALREQMDALHASQGEAQDRWTTALAQMRSNLGEAIAEISRIDEAAIANARRRIDALSEASRTVDESIARTIAAFEEEHEQRRSALTAAESEALEALKARLAAFDAEAAQRQEAHLAHMAALAERGEALAARLGALDAELARLAQVNSEEGSRLGAASEALTSNLSQSRSLLAETGRQIGSLTDESVRLLELIRATSDHSTADLAKAIGAADAKLTAFQQRADALGTVIADAEAKGGALAEHIGQARETGEGTLQVLGDLETRLAALAEQARSLSESTDAEFRKVVDDIAQQLGARGSTVLNHALQSSADEAIANLEQAIANAAEQGRATTSQLRNQLAKVNELAGNLEQRVAQARAHAEEQVNNDFTRRMALITDSLNSCSIDIARALDAEVTDTAWASYLRGDRGIFTRRAVRLLDNQQARAISEVYEADDEMREAVNRYIHDFEALLRPVLSTRDGNALAVTLLSSDIGRLYVVLAQAIERLRT